MRIQAYGFIEGCSMFEGGYRVAWVYRGAYA